MPQESKMSEVGVWLTNYASEPYLPAAIEGVLNQSYKDLTLYIADNHSPGEGVKRIIDSFARHDKRVVPLDIPLDLAGIPLMRFVWNFLNDQDHKYTITLGGHDAWPEDNFLDSLVGRMREDSKIKRPAIVVPDTWQLNFENQITSHYGD